MFPEVSVLLFTEEGGMWVHPVLVLDGVAGMYNDQVTLPLSYTRHSRRWGHPTPFPEVWSTMVRMVEGRRGRYCLEMSTESCLLAVVLNCSAGLTWQSLNGENIFSSKGKTYPHFSTDIYVFSMSVEFDQESD